MQRRTIGIIGAGRVGTALANGFSRVGHEVRVGARDPGSEKSHLRAAALAPVPLVSLEAAVDGATVVVLAVPMGAIADAVDSIGPISDVVVVDATNPVGGRPPDEFPTLGAYVTALLPDAHVVKAFNTIGAEHLGDGRLGGGRVVLPIAGSDGGRPVVAELADALGFEVADLGGIEAIELSERFAALWIHLAFQRGWGRDFGFGVLRA